MQKEADFFIGTATASYQVEGYKNLKEDKTDWGLAALKGKIKHVGTGPDQWRLYKKDFELMKKLGLKAYRFSIEPARVMPSEGKIDKKALEHYKDMLKSAKKNNIIPIVNLSHYTLPAYLADKGSFENKSAVLEFFKAYGEAIKSAGLDFQYLLTINEPNLLAFVGYFFGLYPPFKHSIKGMRDAWNTQLEVHKLLYNMLKPYGYEISFAHAMSTFKNLLGFSNIIDEKYNFSTLEKLKNHLDFISINYYFDFNPKNMLINAFNGKHPFRDSRRFYDVLEKTHKRFGKPILISENGMHTQKDPERIAYIKEFLKVPYTASSNGIDIMGYLHWSFIDNYEWIFGYGSKFGIVGFDPRTKKRIIKPSARLLGRVSRFGEKALI